MSKKRNKNGGYIQPIKVPLTIKRKAEDGTILELPNHHPKAGKTIFIKHKPKAQ